MGLEVLFWIWVLTWMTKTAATDVLHAVKGTPNPRYELKKQKAAAAGQPVKGQPRYGSRDWAADLLSDALAANTEKRRKAAKAKAAPLDDLADAVREPRPATKPVPVPAVRHETPEPPVPPAPKPEPEPIPDTRPDATIIRFPNPKKIEKEITMANTEVTGLSAALAFAAEASAAHNNFATAGSEGYTAALASFEVGPECVGSAVEAQEASQTAAAKWQAHKEHLEAQLGVKEAYQANPDAGNKTFLLNA